MPAIAFDSFRGLPARWRDGFEAGAFACEPPSVPNAQIVTGLFEDTLPGFEWPEYIGLCHLDADLYTSTATALKYIGPHLKPGCFIVFDEYHSWPGWENDGECLAWREFAADNDISFVTVGHGPEQLALRLT
jgi:hypothetical protein